MSTVIFDTLAYSKKLKKAGFSQLQAEIQAEAMAELVHEKLATKHDIKLLEERLTFRLTIRLGSMLVVAVGIFATLMKII